MNKQKFIDIIGEDPEDMFGSDWQNELLCLEEDFDESEIDEDDEKYSIDEETEELEKINNGEIS